MGSQLQKALPHGLPIIIINPIPGQEEENALFLESKNVAMWIHKDDDVKEKLMSIFNNPDVIKNMKINARLLSKKNSTKDICNILMKNI